VSLRSKGSRDPPTWARRRTPIWARQAYSNSFQRTFLALARKGQSYADRVTSVKGHLSQEPALSRRPRCIPTRCRPRDSRGRGERRSLANRRDRPDPRVPVSVADCQSTSAGPRASTAFFRLFTFDDLDEQVTVMQTLMATRPRPLPNSHPDPDARGRPRAPGSLSRPRRPLTRYPVRAEVLSCAQASY